MKYLLVGLTLLVSFNLFANVPWEPLKEIVLKCDLMNGNRKTKLKLLKQARAMGDQCVAQHPNEAGCYYYRAQATGLYYEAVVFGYQNGVRSMLQDWQKARELDSGFDHGGPDRMLGEVYTSLPKYFGTKDVRQNLNKSFDYLQKAIEIAPDYPTQHLDMAEAFLKAKKREDALQALQTAQELIPKWSNDPYYPGWQENAKDLEKQLKGVTYGKRE